MVGYLCAYLRYYHPAEFITAYLNNANGDDDIASGSELADLYGIRIASPKFGISRDRYSYDSPSNTIAKGVASVKFLNADLANHLYEIAHHEKPHSFVELLKRLYAETSINIRQLEILIKIDYFSSYGNPRELLRINDFFEKFKRGELSQIKKEGLDPELTAILERHATGLTKTGKPAKTYTITDMPGLLAEIEDAIKAKHLDDFDMRLKIQTQLECLGYIDLTSGKPEDRRKLIVTEVYPLVNKDRKIPWAYAIQTRSIGTGKVSRLTVRAKIFDADPIVQYDTIYASDVQKMTRADKTYWYLLSYRHVY